MRQSLQIKTLFISLPIIGLLISAQLSMADDYQCRDLCGDLGGQIKIDPKLSRCLKFKNSAKSASEESFRKLSTGMGWSEVCALVGTGSCVCGSGIARQAYRLTDGGIGMLFMNDRSNGGDNQELLSAWEITHPNGEKESSKNNFAKSSFERIIINGSAQKTAK